MFSIYLIEPAEAVRTTEHFVPLSPRGTSGERAGERGVPNPNGLLSPTLSSLWEEREKKLASGPPNLRFSPSIRLNLKAIWNYRVSRVDASFSLNHPGRLVVMPSTPAATSLPAFAGESTVQT